MRDLFLILIGVVIYAVACAPNRKPASLPYEVSKFLDVDVTCYVRGEQGISCVRNR